MVQCYVCETKKKLRNLINFLISQRREITVQIEGNRTPYTSRIIKAVNGDILSKVGRGEALIIEKLTPDTGNGFFKFSPRVVIKFLLRNQSCQFESEYLGESTKNPPTGLIVSFPESVGIK